MSEETQSDYVEEVLAGAIVVRLNRPPVEPEPPPEEE